MRLDARLIEGTAYSDANIILKYTGPDGNVITEVVTAGTDGAYTDAFEPSDEGLWSVEASWEGDTGHNPSASGTLEFTVTEPKRELGGEGGIPGFPWELTMLGLAAGLSVLLMLRRRQQRRPYPNAGGDPGETVFTLFGPVDQG